MKDTVHKQSLLHHVCSVVVENFPQSTDLYSEIGAITRSAKVRYPGTHLQVFQEVEQRYVLQSDDLL